MEPIIETKFGNIGIEISKLQLSLDDILIFRGDIPTENVDNILLALQNLDIKQPILLLRSDQYLETMTVDQLQQLVARYIANPDAEVH